MQSQLTGVLALLDREVLHAGAAHDLRSALTAARGRLELREEGMPVALEPSFARMDGVARELGAVVQGHVPVCVLDEALDALGAVGRSRRDEEGRRLDILEGIDGTGIVRPWGLALAQAWLVEDGTALAGARVRVAAWLVGATCRYVPDVDGVHGTLTVRRAAG